MTKRFKTFTGSVYSVDCEKLRWKRESKTDRSGDIREGLDGYGESGSLAHCPEIEKGRSTVLISPTGRYVITSRVEEILE